MLSGDEVKHLPFSFHYSTPGSTGQFRTLFLDPETTLPKMMRGNDTATNMTISLEKGILSQHFDQL